MFADMLRLLRLGRESMQVDLPWTADFAWNRTTRTDSPAFRGLQGLSLADNAGAVRLSPVKRRNVTVSRKPLEIGRLGAVCNPIREGFLSWPMPRQRGVTGQVEPLPPVPWRRAGRGCCGERPGWLRLDFFPYYVKIPANHEHGGGVRCGTD